MEQESFSQVLSRALNLAANEHGQHYPDGGAEAWALTGATYLGFALCGLPSTQLRNIQYSTHEQFGPVILDCKWYDGIKQECLDGKNQTDALLPDPNDTLCRCTVSEQLFLEMLDFLREG